MSDAGVGGLLLRMLLSLGVVTGLLVLAGRFLSGQRLTGPRVGGRTARPGTRPARRRPPRDPDALHVLARQQLGRTQSVAVLQAAGRTLVVGVTPERVSLLAAGDEPLRTSAVTVLADPALGAAVGDGTDRLPAPATAPGPGWRPVLDALRDRTVRRS